MKNFFLFFFFFFFPFFFLFWLTISYQKPFLYSVSVLWSQIFTLKLNLQPKVGLTYAISIVKWLVWNFKLRKHFLVFFAAFELWLFYNNIAKFQKKKKQKSKRNLLKLCLQFTYTTDFCIICIYFNYGKMKIFDFVCVKRQANNDVLKDVGSTVVRLRQLATSVVATFVSMFISHTGHSCNNIFVIKTANWKIVYTDINEYSQERKHSFPRHWKKKRW